MPEAAKTYKAETLAYAIHFIKQNNVDYTGLDVSKMRLEDADITCLCRAFEENITLISLKAKNNRIGELGAKEIAKIEALIELDFNYNQIGDIGATALAHNNKLKTLLVWKNKIDDIGAIALAQNSNLSVLEDDNNEITDIGAIALSENTNFTSIELWDNKISFRGKKKKHKK